MSDKQVNPPFSTFPRPLPHQTKRKATAAKNREEKHNKKGSQHAMYGMSVCKYMLMRLEEFNRYIRQPGRRFDEGVRILMFSTASVVGWSSTFGEWGVGEPVEEIEYVAEVTGYA